MTPVLKIPDSFEIVYILPNLVLSDPVESDAVALLPSTDQRVLEKAKNNKALRALVTGFTDEKGRHREVSVLAFNRHTIAEKNLNEALVSFRNAFALSCIVNAVA